jgi:hypothetical protein
MKRINSSWVIGILLMTIGLSRNVSASLTEETQLKDSQTQIDQHAAAWSNDDHIDRLAKHYKVPATTVQELSTHNQGWGAVTIELAMAWELNTMHPQEFPFMTASLKRVETLRSEGKDWGAIARLQEFGLAPVVQEAKNTAEGLRQDDLKLTQLNQESDKVTENRRIIQEEHKIAQDDRANRQ